MSEILFVLSLFVVLVWIIIRAVLLVVQIEPPGFVSAPHRDPITNYVEENYGSHFQSEPRSFQRSLRNP